MITLFAHAVCYFYCEETLAIFYSLFILNHVTDQFVITIIIYELFHQVFF